MRIFIYDGAGEFGQVCELIATARGFEPVREPRYATVAIAPLLRRRLTEAEWTAPHYGTLIFHPSALPYRRGPDAIRHTIAAGERVSAATWFWCSDGLDRGDICEQEVVVLHPGESPREAYARRFIPAGCYALSRALEGIVHGRPRSVAQETALATYDPPFRKAA